MHEDHDDDEGFDLIEALRKPAGLPDATLGGYMTRHDRPVAMEGADGQAYTVDIEVEALDDGTAFASFLVFVRWAETGGGIMDHRESEDVVVAGTEQEARDAALALPLERVKELLDGAIRRRIEDEATEEA